MHQHCINLNQPAPTLYKQILSSNFLFQIPKYKLGTRDIPIPDRAIRNITVSIGKGKRGQGAEEGKS